MRSTTHIHNRSTAARRALFALTVLAASPIVHSSTVSATSTPPASDATPNPRLLDGDFADVLVRVRGGATCSGTPITGTRYVVTAAHCVLDLDGQPAARTVVRGDETYNATSVLVDQRYFDEPSSQLDAAVLVLDREVPGASATIGATIPTTGLVTVAGYQPLDTDGTLLRGTRPDNRPTPNGAVGTIITIESAPTGCSVSNESVLITRRHVSVSCGLIPGASGGGLFAKLDGDVVLVGIISTVSADLTKNGLVPLESLHKLLRHPERYRHDVTAAQHHRGSVRMILS